MKSDPMKCLMNVMMCAMAEMMLMFETDRFANLIVVMMKRLFSTVLNAVAGK